MNACAICLEPHPAMTILPCSHVLGAECAEVIYQRQEVAQQALRLSGYLFSALNRIDFEGELVEIVNQVKAPQRQLYPLCERYMQVIDRNWLEVDVGENSLDESVPYQRNGLVAGARELKYITRTDSDKLLATVDKLEAAIREIRMFRAIVRDIDKASKKAQAIREACPLCRAPAVLTNGLMLSTEAQFFQDSVTLHRFFKLLNRGLIRVTEKEGESVALHEHEGRLELSLTWINRMLKVKNYSPFLNFKVVSGFKKYVIEFAIPEIRRLVGLGYVDCIKVFVGPIRDLLGLHERAFEKIVAKEVGVSFSTSKRQRILSEVKASLFFVEYFVMKQLMQVEHGHIHIVEFQEFVADFFDEVLLQGLSSNSALTQMLLRRSGSGFGTGLYQYRQSTAFLYHLPDAFRQVRSIHLQMMWINLGVHNKYISTDFCETLIVICELLQQNNKVSDLLHDAGVFRIVFRQLELAFTNIRGSKRASVPDGFLQVRQLYYQTFANELQDKVSAMDWFIITEPEFVQGREKRQKVGDKSVV